ncbi:Uncharacterised protein [Candidatus Burarchaeum australiense]|nr:Uncharacterised protein [Candidatus Burarchaeum australiense]
MSPGYAQQPSPSQGISTEQLQAMSTDYAQSRINLLKPHDTQDGQNVNCGYVQSIINRLDGRIQKYHDILQTLDISSPEYNNYLILIARLQEVKNNLNDIIGQIEAMPAKLSANDPNLQQEFQKLYGLTTNVLALERYSYQIGWREELTGDNGAHGAEFRNYLLGGMDDINKLIAELQNPSSDSPYRCLDQRTRNAMIERLGYPMDYLRTAVHDFDLVGSDTQWINPATGEVVPDTVARADASNACGAFNGCEIELSNHLHANDLYNQEVRNGTAPWIARLHSLGFNAQTWADIGMGVLGLVALGTGDVPAAGAVSIYFSLRGAENNAIYVINHGSFDWNQETVGNTVMMLAPLTGSLGAAFEGTPLGTTLSLSSQAGGLYLLTSGGGSILSTIADGTKTGFTPSDWGNIVQNGIFVTVGVITIARPEAAAKETDRLRLEKDPIAEGIRNGDLLEKVPTRTGGTKGASSGTALLPDGKLPEVVAAENLANGILSDANKRLRNGTDADKRAFCQEQRRSGGLEKAERALRKTGIAEDGILADQLGEVRREAEAFRHEDAQAFARKMAGDTEAIRSGSANERKLMMPELEDACYQLGRTAAEKWAGLISRHVLNSPAHKWGSKEAFVKYDRFLKENSGYTVEDFVSAYDTVSRLREMKKNGQVPAAWNLGPIGEPVGVKFLERYATVLDIMGAGAEAKELRGFAFASDYGADLRMMEGGLVKETQLARAYVILGENVSVEFVGFIKTMIAKGDWPTTAEGEKALKSWMTKAYEACRKADPNSPAYDPNSPKLEVQDFIDAYDIRKKTEGYETINPDPETLGRVIEALKIMGDDITVALLREYMETPERGIGGNYYVPDSNPNSITGWKSTNERTQIEAAISAVNEGDAALEKFYAATSKERCEAICKLFRYMGTAEGNRMADVLENFVARFEEGMRKFADERVSLVESDPNADPAAIGGGRWCLERIYAMVGSEAAAKYSEYIVESVKRRQTTLDFSLFHIADEVKGFERRNVSPAEAAASITSQPGEAEGTAAVPVETSEKDTLEYVPPSERETLEFAPPEGQKTRETEGRPNPPGGWMPGASEGAQAADMSDTQLLVAAETGRVTPQIRDEIEKRLDDAHYEFALDYKEVGILARSIDYKSPLMRDAIVKAKSLGDEELYDALMTDEHDGPLFPDVKTEVEELEQGAQMRFLAGIKGETRDFISHEMIAALVNEADARLDAGTMKLDAGRIATLKERIGYEPPAEREARKERNAAAGEGAHLLDEEHFFQPSEDVTGAVSRGDTVVMDYVLTLGVVDVNGTDGQGRSLLRLACETGNARMVDLLCKWGATVDDATLQYARETGLEEIANNLETYKEMGLQGVFDGAIARANFGQMSYLIRRGADMNFVDERGPAEMNTPLRTACFMGDVEVVNFVLEHGAVVGEADLSYVRGLLGEQGLDRELAVEYAQIISVLETRYQARQGAGVESGQAP